MLSGGYQDVGGLLFLLPLISACVPNQKQTWDRGRWPHGDDAVRVCVTRATQREEESVCIRVASENHVILLTCIGLANRSNQPETNWFKLCAQ